METEALSSSRNTSNGPVEEHVHIYAETIGISIKVFTPWVHRLARLPFVAKRKPESAFQENVILHGVSMVAPKQSLTTILGTSGSGKTTLLDCLAGRMRGSEIDRTGRILYSADLRSFKSSYLVQRDILTSSLTVRECLGYSAELRCRLDGPQERDDVVDRMLQKLGLRGCADTRIGTHSHKGCSGGEKRRVSIGIQLLGDSEILFCDEPTTGLDAATALHVIRTLKHLAAQGFTVIISVHAPRSDIWRYFDQIVLLSQGSVLYSGKADHAIPYFQECGYEIPLFVNPAEFLVELGSVDIRSETSRSLSLARVDSLKGRWSSTQALQRPGFPMLDASHVDNSATTVGIRKRLYVLTRRTFKIGIRSPQVLVSIWIGALIMALVNGWIFMGVDGSLSGIRSRQGSLWDATGLYGYLIMVNEICRLASDIQFFDHERHDRIICVTTFLLSRRLAKLVLDDLLLPSVFTMIYYFMVGYRHSVAQIFIFLLTMILTHFSSVAFATLCIAVTRNLHGAGLMGNLYFTLQMMASGYFLQADQIPIYTRWLKWITHTCYTFGALCANEFLGVGKSRYGQFYDCPDSRDPSHTSCQEYTGKYIVESLGLPHNWIWRPLVIIGAMVVFMYLSAGVVLNYKTAQPVHRRSKPRITGDHTDLEKTKFSSNQNCRGIKVSLDECFLKWRHPLGNSSSLLGPISTTFHPCKLNVILGASGSGKTTLLSALSARTSPWAKAKYTQSGLILYDGALYPDHVVRSAVSFVDQEELDLMPCLTVRETLRFAALLKLPQSGSHEEKEMQAEAIMKKFGLTPCANTPIGNSYIRGISGGERRRVSLACEILKSPDVLVLDEPTSGLDTFTALAIIEVLHKLALEGRTVILSIHQPTATMLQYFASGLVLGPGGQCVYSGPMPDMLPYFQSLSLHCPRGMTATDFVIDLATPDPENVDSQERICYLTQQWEAKCGTLRQEKDMAVSPTTATGSDTFNMRELHPPSFHSACLLTLQRALLNMSRQPVPILARSLQCPGMGIMLALLFAPLQEDYLAVQSRMGFIQQYATLSFIGMIQNVATFPSERDLLYREASEGLYGAECFLIQYTAREAAFEIFSAVLFSLLTVYVIRLQPTPKMLGISTLNTFCLLNCGESISMAFSSLFSDMAFSVNLTCSLLAIFKVLGGVMSLHLPPVLEGFNYISPVKYAIASTAAYSMEGLEFSCTDAQRKPDGSCWIQSGEDVLELYNLTQDPRWSIVAIILCTVGYRIVAYATMKIRMSYGPLVARLVSFHRRSSAAVSD